MFDKIKANLTISVVVALLVVALIALSIVWYQHREVKDLTVAGAQKDGIIAQQQGAASQAQAVIKNQQGTAALTDQSWITLDGMHGANAANQQQVVDATQSQLDAIAEKYKNQPVTPENTAAKEKEVAAAQIDGLWKTYCNTAPDKSACAQ